MTPPCDSVKRLSPSPCLTHFLPVGAHKFFLRVMSMTLVQLNSSIRRKLKINNDVILSGSESQVTDPGTELNIYSDQTTKLMVNDRNGA